MPLRGLTQRFYGVLLLICCMLLLALPAHADTEPDFTDYEVYEFAQRYMLILINHERRAEGLKALRLDPVASQAAKLHAEEMAQAGYLSHWNQAGDKPVRRLNLLGSYHAVAENVFSQLGDLPDLERLLVNALEEFLDSESHRATLLNPFHTHVGLGFALSASGRGFYHVQDFTTQLGGAYDCPLTAKLGSQVEFSGRFDPAKYNMVGVLVRYEPSPQPRGPTWLNQTNEYKNGEEYAAGYTPYPQLSFEEAPTFHTMVVDEERGWFKCQPVLDYRGREGLYYLMLLVNDQQSHAGIWIAIAAIEVTD